MGIQKVEIRRVGGNRGARAESLVWVLKEGLEEAICGSS
jgi:hypothetical protein